MSNKVKTPPTKVLKDLKDLGAATGQTVKTTEKSTDSVGKPAKVEPEDIPNNDVVEAAESVNRNATTKKPVARLDDMAPMPNPAKAKRKSPAKKKADEKPATKVEEPADATPEDETVADYIDSNKPAPPSEQTVEERIELVEEVCVTLPFIRCHVCRHLMPTLPQVLPKTYGGDGKSNYGDEFDCFDKPECPAQRLKMIFNPFSDERIGEAVEAFVDTGSMKELNSLYKEAKKISLGVYEDLHTKVRHKLAEA